MGYDYFSDWNLPILDADDAVGARAALRQSFAEGGLSVEMAEIDADALGAMDGHVLFAFCDDDSLEMTLYAIPEASLSSALRAAMRSVSHTSYGYEECMYGDEAAAAYLRIEAAVGVEDWEDVVEDAREESELELEIDEADQDCLGPFRIGAIPNGGDPDLSAGGLDKRFVMSSSVRRCH